MWRLDISGIWFDAGSFIGRNRFKFFVAFLLAAGGFTFGLINAFARVTTDEALLSIQNYSIVRLAIGERSFFGYFLIRLLLHLLLLAVLTLLGVRELLAYGSFLVIITYAYQCAFFIGAVFCYAGLTVLPLMLLCLIPLSLVFLCVLTYYAVFIVYFAPQARVACFRDISYYAHCVKLPFVCAAAAVACAALLESGLACLLTAGIIL